MDTQAAIEDLLCPDGQIIGAPGSSTRIRQLAGTVNNARNLFDKLAALGEPAPIPAYPGERAEIPGVGYVGLRPVSGSGEPTIDVGAKICGTRNIKLKFIGWS